MHICTYKRKYMYTYVIMYTDTYLPNIVCMKQIAMYTYVCSYVW